MNRYCIVVLGLIGVACGSTAEPTGQPAAKGAGLVGEANGFAYAANRSGFLLGANVVTKTEFGFVKVVGDKGTLATDVKNGSVMGLLNATTSYNSYQGTVADHNRIALEYFVSRGLPVAEIGGIRGNVTLTGSSTATKDIDMRSAARETTSIVSRKLGGVTVVDSRAIVRLGSGGDSVFEQVYWPSVAQEVVSAAAALKTRYDDPTLGASLRAVLPKGASSVVIHHSSFTERGPFQSIAAVDVQGTSVRHFDAAGKEFRLAEELATGQATAK